MVFNLLGALFWWILLNPLTQLTLAVSSQSPARQIANAHTIFNVFNAVVCLAFTGLFADMVERLVPRPATPESEGEPRYLDDAYLSVPSMALERVYLELQHLAELSISLVRQLSVPGELNKVVARVNSLTELHESLVDYLGGITREEMEKRDSRRFECALVVANSLETLGATITDLAEFEQELSEAGSPFLPDLRELHQLTLEALEEASRSVQEPEWAMEVLRRKHQIRVSRDRCLKAALEHLDSDRPGAAGRYRLRSGVVDELRRLYYLASRIARAVLRREGQTSPTGSLY